MPQSGCDGDIFLVSVFCSDRRPPTYRSELIRYNWTLFFCFIYLRCVHVSSSFLLRGSAEESLFDVLPPSSASPSASSRCAITYPLIQQFIRFDLNVAVLRGGASSQHFAETGVATTPSDIYSACYIYPRYKSRSSSRDSNCYPGNVPENPHLSFRRSLRRSFLFFPLCFPPTVFRGLVCHVRSQVAQFLAEHCS